ncbi:DNA repair protein RadC [Agrilactobacillus yilanensis]|uniref:DNA repair protein RadC n=1 Tax=Agrilactobacillus yilanensis TaxID=2485997 RepID=A0ABW4J570_9LACO|nr:DNA repair protein RadC [Agrilactobacillus yilanensis]
MVMSLEMIQKPRERMMLHSAAILSDQELLMVLLGSGTQDLPVELLSDQVLKTIGDVGQLQNISFEALCAIRGIGPSKATILKAAVELGQRVNLAQTLRQGTVLSSEALGDWLLKYYRGLKQEQLMVIFLDHKNQIISHEIIFKGGLNTSVAHPREIFHKAVLLSCARFVVCHNHPSGQPKPSKNDIAFTKKLVACGELMGISCLDHIIVGHQSYLSLRAENII